MKKENKCGNEVRRIHLLKISALLISAQQADVDSQLSLELGRNDCLVMVEPKFTAMKFSFGQTERDRIDVDVIGYERAPVGEYFDDNWLTIKIHVHAGGFCGKVDASILTGELEKFCSELRNLFDTLKGAAEFTTLEEQLSLKLDGDGKGHIELHGEVEAGHRLIFKLEFDQSQLGVSIRELEGVLSRFPVRLTKDT